MDEIEVHMGNYQSKTPPTWADVKAVLGDFDRGALLQLSTIFTLHTNIISYFFMPALALGYK
jgi:hypothetical protein